VVALLFNAFVWGLSWLPFRHLDQLGMAALWSTSGLYALSALALLAARPRALGDLCRSPGLWALTLASGLTNACFNWGVTVGEVVRVVLLFYLMPVWSMIGARWLLGETISAKGLLQVLLAISGAALVLWRPGMGLPLPSQLGDWLGLFGGMAFALTNLLLRKYAEMPTASRALAMFLGGASLPAGLALALQPFGWVNPMPAWSLTWFWPLMLLTLAFAAANMALQYGAARLAARLTALVMLSELLFAVFSALALGGETLGVFTVIGATLILGATLWGLKDAQPEGKPT
ncbi:MAG: DMT family transporter, partial [Betaproteobacteria bacterium]|nr:DMT family transporter [Betaproteobacteria bacterium]